MTSPSQSPSSVTIFFVLCLVLSNNLQVDGAAYLGKFLGKLTELHHGVSGEVYAVDARTLHIKDFTYDGQGPAAYFFAGTSRAPSNTGFRIRDENGSPEVLRRYRKEGVTITLPEGKSLNNIKWFSVWCEEFEVNFGDVKIPKNFDYPRPQKIDGLRGVHNVNSENIVIVDAQTLLVPSLSYDGEAPDAKFWVGRGPKPSPQGVRVPDENGKEIPLRRYDRKTVVLTLPGDLTVFDIGHFGIWCEAFTVDFGHVQIPANLNVPPSLRMLGVSPQKRPSDYPSVHAHAQSQSQPQPQQQHHVQQLGRVDATTYRPPSQFSAIFAQRRADQLNFNPNPPSAQQLQQPSQQQAFQSNSRHDVVNRDIYSRNHAANSINNLNALSNEQQFIQFNQNKHQPTNLHSLQSNLQNNQLSFNLQNQQYNNQFQPAFITHAQQLENFRHNQHNLQLHVQNHPRNLQNQHTQQTNLQIQPNILQRRPVPYTPFDQINPTHAQNAQSSQNAYNTAQNRNFQSQANFYQFG